jgi:hypothetical protein
MFGSKKKKFAKAANRFLTGSSLLKFAVVGDKESMVAIVTGQTADDDGLWHAIESFIMVAHRHPGVVQHLREVQRSLPAKTQLAYDSTIRAATAGSPKMFQGGDIASQGLLLISLSFAIAEDPEALADAMVTLGENA